MSKKKKRGGKGGDTDKILRLLERADRPVPLKRLLRTLAPKKARHREILHTIQSLEEQGTLTSLDNGRSYLLTRKLAQAQGALEITASGAGFVLPEQANHPDIFIAPSNLQGAWPGDRVRVAVLPRTGKKNPEGRIVKVLERNLETVLVVLTQEKCPRTFWGRSADTSLRLTFAVDTRDLESPPRIGEVLEVDDLKQLTPGFFTARARTDLGPETDASVQETIVKVTRGISRKFPERVHQAATLLPDHPLSEESEARRDLRSLPFVTIDGEEARDFDDAICVLKSEQGSRLLVAIADVSHYVAPGSPLDQEAAQRGNSFYFPCSVEPMFPEKLSAGLCSLLPERDRLVMTADLHFTGSGQRTRVDLYPAVIRSRARLTYAQVNQALSGPSAPEGLQDHLPMLRQAAELAGQLRRNRRQRGSLDFDLPEPAFVIDEKNRPKEVRAREQRVGEQLIEDCMLAANEAVAEHLESKDHPCLYRIHPEPDEEKIAQLLTLLAQTEVTPPSASPSPKDLQQLLGNVAGTRHEFLVNRLLLRTMMQAAYDPDNQGHFGLASEVYCHFTSPIRRYADLIVHRLLKAALKLAPEPGGAARKLSKIAEHLNTQERKAVAAEREIHKRLLILLLAERIGEVFEGIIASVGEKGCWVEFWDGLAEGFLRLEQRRDESFELIREEHRLRGVRTGESYQIGDQIRVRLQNCSLARLEIDLEVEARG